MTRKGWLVSGALVVAVVVWLARRPLHGRREAAANDIEAATAHAQAGSDEAHAVGENGAAPAGAVSSRAEEERRRGFELGRRLFLPRPPGMEALVAPPSHHPKALAPAGGGIEDRRENPGPDSAQLMAELHKRMGEVRASAAHCLDGWAQADPSLDAGVVLAISVDDRGLKDVWIMDRDEAPSGPLACLSNAVYPVDWSGLTKAPMRLTVKIGYARDAGEA